MEGGLRLLLDGIRQNVLAVFLLCLKAYPYPASEPVEPSPEPPDRTAGRRPPPLPQATARRGHGRTPRQRGAAATAGAAHPGEDTGTILWPTTPEGIREAMDSIVSDVETCYRGWLIENPDLEGRIALELTISGAAEDSGRGLDAEAWAITGLVASVEGIQHPVFEGCVKNAVVQLQFEAAADGEPVSVGLPFRFLRRESRRNRK